MYNLLLLPKREEGRRLESAVCMELGNLKLLGIFKVFVKIELEEKNILYSLVKPDYFNQRMLMFIKFDTSKSE